jgi:hypothetical protein
MFPSSSSSTLLRRSARLAHRGVMTPLPATNTVSPLSNVAPLRRSHRLANKATTHTPTIRVCISLGDFYNNMDLFVNMHETLSKLRNRAGTLMRMRNLSDLFTFISLNRKFCSTNITVATFNVRNTLNADIYNSRYRDDPKFKAAAKRLQTILANFE